MASWHGKANLVTGRQLRAARVLAGLTQYELAEAMGVTERSVRHWEKRYESKPTSAPNDRRLEEVLLALGIVLFSDPSPGVRLIK